ncbi:MAG: hypothetical protein M0Q15_05970 [Nevskia sp.]|jgi:IS5 family transposase|nr:hypothetical protein [Nevskia sp.]
MKQQTLANGFEKCQRTAKCRKFLSEKEQIMPWAELCRLIKPYYYYYTGRSGRKPMGLGRMLRIYFLQQWFIDSATK